MNPQFEIKAHSCTLSHIRYSCSNPRKILLQQNRNTVAEINIPKIAKYTTCTRVTVLILDKRPYVCCVRECVLECEGVICQRLIQCGGVVIHPHTSFYCPNILRTSHPWPWTTSAYVCIAVLVCELEGVIGVRHSMRS